MANIKIDFINVYPIIEEFCQANQLIAEVQVSRTDSNPPNIRYYPYDTSEIYKYISINENTGKVYLTLEGVNAINADYPDNPSQEINELDFTIVAKDIEVGDSINIDVKVAVIRVHDEPPKIVDQVKYTLYQDDLNTNYRVLDVRTEFPAIFISKTPYITFPVNDIGRALLTNEGVDYFKSLDTSSGPQSFEFEFSIIDSYNNKSIDQVVTLEIVSGSGYAKVPKKSILSEVGALLGKDIGQNLSYKNSKIDNNEKLINNIQNDLIDNNFYFQNYKGPALSELFLNDDKRITENFKKQIEDLLGKINEDEKTFIKGFDTLASENYKHQNYYLNYISEINNFDLNNSYEEYLSQIINTHIQNIDETINAKIEKLITIIENAIYDVTTKILAELSATQLSLDQFKRVTYCNDYNDFNNRINNLTTGEDKILYAISEDSYNDFISDIVNNTSNTTFVTYINNISNGSSQPILKRLDTNESHISDHETRISTLENYDLTDWGGSASWEFTQSGTSGALKFYNNNILSTTASGGTVTLASSVSSTTKIMTNNIALTMIGDNATFSSTGTTTVIADIFNGTATSAKYADLAEYYLADKSYDYGTVLMIGGEKEVTLPKKENVRDFVPIIGIVSEKPGFIINNELAEKENAVLIALKGQTPVKILPSLNIKKGERLYASLKHPGKATTIHEYGEHKEDLFLGYALEDKKYNESKSYIKIFIK